MQDDLGRPQKPQPPANGQIGHLHNDGIGLEGGGESTKGAIVIGVFVSAVVVCPFGSVRGGRPAWGR